MLLFYRIKFSKLKCFIDMYSSQVFFTNISINIVKKKYNFFRFVQVYEFGLLGLYVLKKLLSSIVFYFCIQTKNEIHSLLYSTSNADTFPKVLRNFRKQFQFLTCDYLIVNLLLPRGAFCF